MIQYIFANFVEESYDRTTTHGRSPAGLNSVHTIIVREEVSGTLRLMGEHRDRKVVDNRPDETILLTRVCASIEEAIKDAQVSQDNILTIGVASPGQIDSDEGVILFSPLFNLSKYPFPFVKALQESFGNYHITLINNDDAHGIGEQRIGVGKDVKDLVYLRIGYNIGSSIIIDGKLYAGADNLAGEFGHMVVDLNGPECSCGNRGCLDVLVSRAAMQRELLERYLAGEKTVLAEELGKDPLDINAAFIYDAIDQEDVLTQEVVEKAADVLGTGIANIINFLNPHRIILGGDVVDEIDLFFEEAVESARRKSLHASMRNVSIMRGMLGTTAGAYGAAVYAKQRFDQTYNHRDSSQA